MKKFLLIAGGAVIMAAASVWGYSYHQEQTMDPWLKANIAALSSAEDLGQGESSGGMDCKYIVNDGKCEITVGVSGKIKLLGGTILYAGADGKIVFDGKVTCSTGGTTSCIHVTCKELYSIVF